MMQVAMAFVPLLLILVGWFSISFSAGYCMAAKQFSPRVGYTWAVIGVVAFAGYALLHILANSN